MIYTSSININRVKIHKPPSYFKQNITQKTIKESTKNFTMAEETTKTILFEIQSLEFLKVIRILSD